jgi:hypothetical protein
MNGAWDGSVHKGVEVAGYGLTAETAWRVVKFLDDIGIEDGIIGDRIKRLKGYKFEYCVVDEHDPDGNLRGKIMFRPNLDA